MLRFWLALAFLISATFSYGQAYKVDPIRGDSLDQSPYKIIKKIMLVGNKRTKDHIITRELTFKSGDTLDNTTFQEELEQSRKNILNTSLFNFAAINWTIEGNAEVIIYILLTERWYIWPAPILEIDDTNFNTWWRSQDYSRVNYGFNISHQNFRGRKESLKLIMKLGFTERIRVAYSIPYLNKKQISGLGFGFSYSRQHTVAYLTDNNERLQFRSQGDHAFNKVSASIRYTQRRKIFDRHSISASYEYINIIDSVRILNPDYLGSNRLKTSYIALQYSYVLDKRDSKNYPLKGHFFSFSARKEGIGLLNNGIDLMDFVVNYRQFWQIGDRFFLAGRLAGEAAINNDQPYFLQNGLNYGERGLRSYEFYVIDGQNIGLAKAQLRYQLIAPAKMKVGVIPFDNFNTFHYAFYLGVFTDAAYVQDNTGYPNNRLANEIQFGSGIGLDFVTYYDMVFRLEYSVNKFGESGLFLHFVAPI